MASLVVGLGTPPPEHPLPPSRQRLYFARFCSGEAFEPVPLPHVSDREIVSYLSSGHQLDCYWDEAEYHRDRFDGVQSSLVGSVLNHWTLLLDVRNYHSTAQDIV